MPAVPLLMIVLSAMSMPSGRRHQDELHPGAGIRVHRVVGDRGVDQQRAGRVDVDVAPWKLNSMPLRLFDSVLLSIRMSSILALAKRLISMPSFVFQ